jgi:hypothetical protein
MARRIHRLCMAVDETTSYPQIAAEDVGEAVDESG